MFRTTCLIGTTLVCLAIATLPVAGQGRIPSAIDSGVRSRTLPGTRVDVFATIQGNALTSTNRAARERFCPRARCARRAHRRVRR